MSSEPGNSMRATDQLSHMAHESDAGTRRHNHACCGTDLTQRPLRLRCGQLLLAGFELLYCEFPVTGLPLLRNPMLRLTRLTVDLSECGCDNMGSATLEPLLLLLCMPHDRAVPLRRLKVVHWPLDGESEQSVQEQLEAAFGVTGVAIDLMYDDMSE